MPITLHVHRRATSPPGEVERQFLAGALEARPVNATKVLRFRRRFDQVVKTIHQRAHTIGAAECLEWCNLWNRQERTSQNRYSLGAPNLFRFTVHP